VLPSLHLDNDDDEVLLQWFWCIGRKQEQDKTLTCRQFRELLLE